MTSEPESLEDIQDAILDRFHAGERIDATALLAEHPEHAGALQRFLQVMNVLEEPAPAQHSQSRLGDYEIRQEIGRGGMGVVYEALQLSLKRPVALKILPPALRFDRQLLKRFQREAEAAGRLRHPNIVPVYTTGEAGGAPFFAMELVDGRSLAQLLALWRGDDDAAAATPWGRDAFHDESARVTWCVELMARVLEALDYAHGQGIIHRDVKPGNILVEDDGTPRLTDFGLALDMDASELTVAGEVFGSPLYMSPEQAQRASAPLDARTDIYSVAVTLYELVTLRLPYDGESRATLLGALAEGRLVPARDAHAEVSPALDAALMRALQREPGQRYRSAGLFAQALRAALEQPEEVGAAEPAGRARQQVGAAAVGASPTTTPSPAARTVQPTTAEPSVADRTRSRGSNTVLKVVIVLAVLGLGAVLLVVGAMLLFGVRQAAPPPSAAPAPVPAPSEPAEPAPPGLSSADLLGLATGQHTGGQGLLEDWLSTARLELRDTVARNEDGLLRVVWPHVGPSLLVDPWVGVRLATSLDGGPWRFEPWSELHLTAQPDDGVLSLVSGFLAQSTGTTRVALERPLHELLDEDALARDEVVLRVRLQLRVQPAEGASTGEVFTGTQAHWQTQRVLSVVDRHPDDVPMPVSVAAYAPVFEQALTPTHAVVEDADGERPALVLSFLERPRGPVPGAFELAVFAPGLDAERPLATTTLLTSATDPTELGRAGDGERFDLRVPTHAADADAAGLLHELGAGRVDRLTLRFVPSWSLARREPTLDECWAEPVVTEVLVGG